MTDPRFLLDDFPAHDPAAWRSEVERLLKGAPYESRMIRRTLEGLEIAGLYHAPDTADGVWGASLPGAAPYLRGTTAAGRHAGGWLVAQQLLFTRPEDFNAALRHDLQRGQDTVVLHLDAAGRAGCDPGEMPAGVGVGGTSIANVDDLDTALAGVDLAALPVMIRTGAAPLAAAGLVNALLARRGAPAGRLRGFLGDDPFGRWARDGVRAPAAELHDEIALLARWAAAEAPGLRTVAVGDGAWHDGGADRALSLGLTLAAGVELMRELEPRGVDPAALAARLQIELTLGSDFFLEIAALRALRVLWCDVLAHAGCPAGAARSWVHAATSGRTLARRDPHVNLLRGTTQAMSAVLGGADSLYVRPFDGDDGAPSAAGRRLARNVQLILAHECRLDQVGDPAGGSWYVESLTRDLAAAAWSALQDVEKAGGLTAALRSGMVQERVAESAARRDANLAVRRDVLVGVNQFPPTQPATVPDKPAPDTGWLERRRAAPTVKPDAAGPLDLRGDAAAAMAAMTAAAAAGATLGGLSCTLLPLPEAAPEPCCAIPVRRDDEPFEALANLVAGATAADPLRGRVLCLCLGDAARYMPRLDFVRSFLRVGGFTPVGEGFHTGAADAAAAVRADGARAVVLVGLDETYAGLGVEVAAALAGAPGAPYLLAAGQPDCRPDLETAGVAQFIHLRSDLIGELGTLFAQMGGRS
jgi:methylmalonyl-CoA mutase